MGNLTPGTISIHALCEEGDSMRERMMPVPSSFLSTPSARRATMQVITDAKELEFLSTPSARRATFAVHC